MRNESKQLSPILAHLEPSPSFPIKPSHAPAIIELNSSKDEADTGEPWWTDAVIYQIFVPSFKDTNADGYGDLNGITEKLNYLVQLGVDVIWLSPIFDSPMYDMGYDISDYYTINPLYGDMEDFNQLLNAAHRKGLRVILDVALNHTSSENRWFKKSVAAHLGEPNGMGDFYIWEDAIEDAQGNKRPPSNWASVFEGCMWEWVPEISKYYLHIFGRAQPDLNWENPHVRRAVYNVLRFWLDKGVDGFRLDAINCISKVRNEDGWPDAQIIWPLRFEQKANQMFANGPRVHDYLREMHDEVFAHYDALALGEMSCGITPELGSEFISRDRGKQELDLIVHFEHVELDCVDGDKWILRDWELPELKAAVSKWQTRMAEVGGWDTVWMENHDQPRGLSRFCKATKICRELGAKLLAMWLFTLQGTVLLYQGQELGMQNPDEFSEDMVRDVETVIYWNAIRSRHKDEGALQMLELARKAIVTKGRDVGRIPIPWSPSCHDSGGFTSSSAHPWLPIHPNLEEFAAEKQIRDHDSVWVFYRNMIRLRKEHKALIYGVYEIIEPNHPSIFAYTRTWVDECYLIALNFVGEDTDWELPPPCREGWSLVTSNYQQGQGDPARRVASDRRMFRPYEGIIWRKIKTDCATHNAEKGGIEIGRPSAGIRCVYAN
ncbi:alpha-amylase [Diplogelasinospora grovesii]|uniref:Alpha-amylase n=1 Tax=Diplogelasinospora grovesii TaxID=303347 RepID=A0AAN6N7Y9_9PEZI|nr:alpha-amylase [Diplogelasinospora grovesii]